MKKKFLLTGSAVIAGAAILGLASCGTDTEKVERKAAEGTKTTHTYEEAPAAPSYAGEGGEVDVYINYAGTSGVARAEGKGTVSDPITGGQLAPGVMLPTWKAFQSYTNTTIKDATDYSKTTDALVWTGVTSSNFKSETDSSRNIDIIYNTTSNFGGATDKLVALDDYIEAGKMPNFKAYLEKNPDVKKMLQKSGKIYYTPYFDGQDDIERMFIMDTALTKKVLDATSGWDTTTTNGGSNPSANVVQGGFYQPFMNADYNYAEDTKVSVLFENQVKTVTVFKTKNIIKQQNELLAKGCTGQELAQQFISYIKEAYDDLFKNGYYTNPSDLFVTDSAAYNADELIALMRVVKANPGMISGDANAEITTFFPRAASNNRIDNMYDLAQIWGVQGVDGENGNFYIGGDGYVHALETTQASYDVLDYLSQIYDEGLILKEFYADANNPNGNGTGFLDKFYKKTLNDSAYGFMMYDYSAATCAANDISDGIGTKATSRKNGFDSGYNCQGITAVLAPLTYWATGSEWKPTDAITSRAGKTLTRYYESNRALKGNSWAIPNTADNVEGAIRLMDVMFSEVGQMVNNYGPVEYWAKPDTSKGDTVANYDANKIYVSTDLVAGEKAPILSSQVKASIASSGKDFWSYSREYLGSTHGIGNVRPKGVNLQATNSYAQAGIANIQSAFTVGGSVEGDGTVLKLATISKVKNSSGETVYTWNTSVPSGFTKAWKDNDNEYTSLTGFWAANKLNKNQGWVAAVTRGHSNAIANIEVKNNQGNDATYAKVLEERDVFNKKALYTYAFSIANDNTYVPAYALTA
jgi:putative aldouronate transport system substrate-binding protein